MFSKGLTKDFNPQRLRLMLTLIFFALAIPTAVLIAQAYMQMKSEAFYQARGMAEELVNRIDATLNDRLNTAEGRNFTDFAFLMVSGDPAANFLQRSPLSNFPVTPDLPGVIGYFQVGANGEFSTPLLPEIGTPPEKVGISKDEYAQRVQLAEKIQKVLADNQLVRSGTANGLRRTIAATVTSPAATLEEEVDANRIDMRQARTRQAAAMAETPSGAATESDRPDLTWMDSVTGFTDEVSSDKGTIETLATAPVKQSAKSNEDYSQQIFDRLNQPKDLLQSGTAIGSVADFDDALGEESTKEQKFRAQNEVFDLKIEAALQKKSDTLERKESRSQSLDIGRENLPARAKRIEQSALPEAVVPQSPEEAGGKASLADLRISTFESEVDPYEFSLLDSGHFVLFRKVWRDGDRYIQGILIDQQVFLNELIEQAFRNTKLSTVSSLWVAYQDDLITIIDGRSDGGSMRVGDLNIGVLYRSHLMDPLSDLQLVFNLHRLLPGPGSGLLRWTIIVITIVFLGGFYALYRTGLSQINLARQQQDFVSAVSHELKTPLTSIRMYGEMLKEGWADDEKRQQYYGYIHDESERLTRLISNVLQLAKITRNEPQFDMKPRSVGELMRQIECKIINQVESAGFELAFEQDPDTDKATIEIDDDCFAQIIINLVDNAIKFSRDAAIKRIEIGCTTSHANTVAFAVRDYGPGVPKDQMKKIFKLFYRSESELTRETVGTGIGLAIVHQLATAMNGKVNVVNRDPGTEFQLSFSLV